MVIRTPSVPIDSGWSAGTLPSAGGLPPSTPPPDCWTPQPPAWPFGPPCYNITGEPDPGLPPTCYYFCNKLGAVETLCMSSGQLQNPFDGPVDYKGPFIRLADAQAVCGCGIGCATAPPPPVPPPINPPLPPVPPPEPPPPEPPPTPPPTPPTEPPTEPPPDQPGDNPPPATLSWPRWCSVNVCQSIAANNDSLQGGEGFNLFQVLGAYDAEGNPDHNSWFYKLSSHLPQAVWDGLVGAVGQVNVWVNDSLGTLAPSATQLGALFLVRAGVDFIQRWLGLGLEDVNRSIGYWINYLAPSEIPSVGDADAAYRAGVISFDQWQCWVRANNVCPDPHQLVFQATVTRPGIREAERLYRAGVINDQTRRDLQRYQGVFAGSDGDYFRELYTEYPGFQDVISFMLRDVWDPAVVASAGLDAEFDEKYTADARRYGDIAGLTPDLARLYWRAHWRLPATGEVYEMVRRLRPGRVPPNLQFTQADGLKLLGVNDVAPGYRERLMALSYRPLSRLDAKRLYYLGVIDQAEVAEVMADEGNPPAQSQLLARGIRQERIKQYLSGSEAQHYLKDGLGRDQYRAFLTSQNLPLEDRDEIVSRLDLRKRAARTEACVKAIRKRYLTGEFGTGDAIATLLAAGVDQGAAEALAAQWGCELVNRGKAVGASVLCKWATAGLISSAEYAARLVRIGYQADDAARMAATCYQDAQDKLRKAQQAAEAKQAAQAARAAQRAANAEQKAQAAAAREQKAADSAAAKAARAEQQAAARAAARAAKQAQAAERAAVQQAELVAAVQQITGQDGPGSRAAVARALQLLMQGQGWDLSASIALTKTAVAKAKSEKRQDWRSILADMVGLPSLSEG